MDVKHREKQMKVRNNTRKLLLFDSIIE